MNDKPMKATLTALTDTEFCNQLEFECRFIESPYIRSLLEQGIQRLGDSGEYGEALEQQAETILDELAVTFDKVDDVCDEIGGLKGLTEIEGHELSEASGTLHNAKDELEKILTTYR